METSASFEARSAPSSYPTREEAARTRRARGGCHVLCRSFSSFRICRPQRTLSAADRERTAALSVRDAAKTLRTSPAMIIRSRCALLKTPPATADFRLADPSENRSSAGVAAGF